MDFKQLRYFTQIADFGNMTRASESLHIAQPALTQQMANLELELGLRVFDRSTQGMKLTAAGDVLYRYAKSLLKQLDDAKAAVSDETEQPSGRVMVGIPGSTGKVLAVPLLRRVMDQERIVLEIVERPSAELLDLVARGRLDIAIVVDPHPCRGAKLAPLLEEDLYVIMTPDSVGSKKAIGLRELAARPLVLPSLPSTIRQRIDTAFMDAGISYRLAGEVSATDMLVRMVAAGLGCTVLPWSAVGYEVKSGLVSALPIARHRLKRHLSICLSDTVPLSRAAEIVHLMILEIIRDLVRRAAWQGAQAAR